MRENRFRALFGGKKPVFGMLHLKGENEEDALARALRETRLMKAGGVDAVIVENYFGTSAYVEAVLAHFSQNDQGILYGVNLLDDDENNFRLACRYGAAFLQLDSIAGHLAPDDDLVFAEFIADWRALFGGPVLGGVRFKYQPYKSGRSLEEDLALAVMRCDAITVTGDATGAETPLAKLAGFRRIVGDFPLVVGAGVTPRNCASHFAQADGAIVGSYFKDTFEAHGEVSLAHVKALTSAVRACRA